METAISLKQILDEYFTINAAGIMLISQMVVALIKVRTVCLSEIAMGFAGNIMPSSDEKRIYRFLRWFPFDPDAVALFAGSRLSRGKWLLTLDRTNWEFGRTHIDILMPAVVYKGAAVPLIWKILVKEDCPNVVKKGNSDTGERKELMSRSVRLFGTERAEALIADRESIGNDRLLRLKSQNIRMIIRPRKKSAGYGFPGNSDKSLLSLSESENRRKPYSRGLRKTGDSELFVCGMKMPGGILLIIATSDKPEDALEDYAKRRQIGTMSACPETRGFGFKSTHPGRIGRLPELS